MHQDMLPVKILIETKFLIGIRSISFKNLHRYLLCCLDLLHFINKNLILH